MTNNPVTRAAKELKRAIQPLIDRYEQERQHRLQERLGISFGSRDVTDEELERTKRQVIGEMENLENTQKL